MGKMGKLKKWDLSASPFYKLTQHFFLSKGGINVSKALKFNA